MEETEVVVLTRERVPTVRPIHVDEIMVLSKLAGKYFGIVIDLDVPYSLGIVCL